MAASLLVASAAGSAFSQIQSPSVPARSPAAQASDAAAVGDADVDRARIAAILMRAAPARGSIRAYYEMVDTPTSKLVQGLDLESGAWFKINSGDVRGYDSNGVYFAGRAQPNAVWPTDPGRNASIIKLSSFVEEAFPQLYPRFIARHPELIERVERSADGGWTLFMTFPCANWILAFAGAKDVASCERKTTQLHVSADGTFVRRGVPGMFDEPEFSKDSPSGWPVPVMLNGPKGWRLTGIDWSATPHPEWFSIQNVEAFAIENAPAISDLPLTAMPDGSLARVAPSGARVPVVPVDTTKGTAPWRPWLLGFGGVMLGGGLFALWWRRRGV
ncbi:MAG: hypothetical protein SFY96_13770 [Planctomycetota bacterium]|nr:hypothetical protein [Planctomycetota bacterium]